MAGWQFTDLVDPVRAARLRVAPSFENIAQHIAEIGVIGRPRTRRQKSEPDGNFRRAEFTVSLAFDPTVLDFFHNSADGYRGRYLRGETEGESANQYLIDVLRPRLIAAWIDWARRPFDAEWLIKGLAGAKAWISPRTMVQRLGPAKYQSRVGRGCLASSSR